jgi:hypothetical protein
LHGLNHRSTTMQPPRNRQPPRGVSQSDLVDRVGRLGKGALRAVRTRQLIDERLIAINNNLAEEDTATAVAEYRGGLPPDLHHAAVSYFWRRGGQGTEVSVLAPMET